MRFIQDIIAERSRNLGADPNSDETGGYSAAADPGRSEHAAGDVAPESGQEAAAAAPDIAPPADPSPGSATEVPGVTGSGQDDETGSGQDDEAGEWGGVLFGSEDDDELAEEDAGKLESIFDPAGEAHLETGDDDHELAMLLSDARSDTAMPTGGDGGDAPSRQDTAHEANRETSERQRAYRALRGANRQAYFASPEQRLDNRADAERGSGDPAQEVQDVREPAPDEPSWASRMAMADAEKPEETVAPPDRIAVPKPSAGRGSARSGRMKTRLLGFSPSSAAQDDPFKASDSSAAPVSSFPVGWLIVVAGPGRGSAFTLFHGVTTIGRGQDQAVRLDFGDNSISRENHAAIAYDPEQGKFYLGHGGKANLVRLDDRPVLSTEELRSESHIRIGETVLRFVALCGEAFNWNEGQEETARHAFRD
jgi:hypothetical protein